MRVTAKMTATVIITKSMSGSELIVLVATTVSETEVVVTVTRE